MSAKYKSPSFLLPNELNTSANTANDTGINSLYSMDFDGSSRIDAGSASYLNSLSQFSISVWFNLTTAASNKCIVSDWNYNTSPKGHFALQTYNASGSNYGLLLFIKATSDVGVNSVQTSAVLTENTWHHAVFTYNSGTVTCYVDGSSVSLTTIGTIPTTLTSQDGNLLIGDFAGLSRYWNGQIDEVAIFNRALDSTEIAALYDGTGSNIRPSNLMATNLNPIAYYPLGEQAQNSGYPSATGNEWQFPNGVLQDYVMDFDGTSPGDAITSNTSGITGNTARTISFWYNIGSSSSAMIPFSLGGINDTNSNSQFAYCINRQDTETTAAIFGRGGNDISPITVPATNDSQWHNVIITYTGSTLALYIDGSNITLPSQPSAYATTDGFKIGGWSQAGNRLFDGKMSNVVVWNTDQSANLANIYNNGSPQTSYTVTPQNWWKLNADSVYTPSAPNYTTALDFSGSGNRVNFNSINLSGNKTVSYWLKPLGAGLIVAGSTFRYYTYYNGSNIIIRDSSGTSSWTNLSIDNTKWHHFCITGDGTNATLYVNGESKGSQPDRSPTVDTIGSYSGGSDGFFNGNVSNLAIYNVILTASQVSTLFNFGTPETNISFDPVAWWKLDDQTAITDSSGNGNTGTNNGATNAPGGVAYVPSWKITSALPIPTVNYTTALDFDGNNDLVNANSVVSSISSSTTGTVSGWIKYTTGGSAAYMITFTSNTNTSQQYLTFQGNSNGVAFAQIKNKWILQTNSAVFTSGNWYHYAVTQNETEPKIYINGTEYSNGNGAALTTYVGTDGTEWWPNLIDFNTVTIGGMIWNSGGTVYTNYGDQDLSNISIYNSALSSSQVSTLFNSGQPEAAISFSPVSWWKLDTGGSTITDYGSGGNNGTNNGATQVTSDVLISGFNIPVNGVSTTLPSTALQQSDLQFDSPYSNYSLSFDGISYINTGTDIGDSLGGSYSGDLTVSMWLKFNSISTQYGLFYIGDLASGGGSFWINTSASKLWVYANNGTAGYINCSISSLNTTDWYNVTCVYKGYDISNSKIYINNTSQTLTTSGNFNYTYDFTGKKTTIADYYTTPPFRGFNGKIDETALWNTALTEAQVLEIYNNGKPGNLYNFSGTAPISWWRLGENAYFNTGTTPGPEFTVPNSIAGAPNGIGSGTVTSMLSADAPGTYANGIGDGLAITDRVGDAPLSVANSQSYNMIPDDKVPYVPGYVGAQTNNVYSMTFDGTNYFNAGNNSSLNWGSGNGTVSCWFKTSYNAPGVQDLVINGSYASGGKGYILYLDSSERVGFYLDDNSSPSGVLSTSSVNDGDWHHVVGVRDSGTMKLYLDGSEIATGTDNTGNIDISDPLIIGAGQAFGGSVGNFFNGQIDEVAIFDTALTADQIKFDLYEPTALVGGVEKTADIENNTNLPTPVAWYRMGD